MNLKECYIKFSNLTDELKSLSLLAARLVLAYGFYGPAMRKWSDINAIGDWFATLGIPLPHLNAYMAATTETVGVILLTLGLLTRLISIPLIVVMLVAIFTVHINNGFDCGNNGFEIPVYYMLFLTIFLSHGAGHYSLDNYIFAKKD